MWKAVEAKRPKKTMRPKRISHIGVPGASGASSLNLLEQIQTKRTMNGLAQSEYILWNGTGFLVLIESRGSLVWFTKAYTI